MDLYNFVFHILTDKALSLPLSSLSLDAQHWLEAQSLGQVERLTGFLVGMVFITKYLRYFNCMLCEQTMMICK